MFSNSSHLPYVILVALWTLHFAAVNATAQVATGIDLLELHDLAGITNVNGSGVNLLHVEAGAAIRDEEGNIVSFSYSPNEGSVQLNSKTFIDVGNPGLTSSGVSSHTTGVGFTIYGSGVGTAPGVGAAGSPPISFQGAFDFINNELGTNLDGSAPAAQNFDVSNHSYVSNLELATGFDPDFAQDKLNRLDFVINDGNMTTVVGTGNNPNNLPPIGFTHCYNVITVGVTDGSHAAGPTTFNGPGRNSVHVVVDHGFTSYATGHVSGAASILHQTGAGSDAVKQEVVKATILAGATKGDVAGTWSRTQTQPLDLVFGAGELNVLNNHLIQQGGEFNGGTTSTSAAPAGFYGWDYENLLAANDERFYEFTIDPLDAVEDFSIALTWNLEVVDGSFSPFSFIAEANDLADLSLELTDLSDNSIVDLSNSAVDNVEHIFIPSLPAGTYQLRVGNGSTNVNTDFGLAFRGAVVDAVLLGDSNLDGVVDFFDIAPMIGLMTSGTYLEQADCNQDGVVDFFDIAPFLQIVAAS